MFCVHCCCVCLQEYAKLKEIGFWDTIIVDEDPKLGIQELRSIVCRMCFASD